MAKTLLIVLQNAYGVEDGFVPTYERPIFRRSHTGIRLQRAIPENISVRIINASPLVGKKAASNLKPDGNYVGKMYEEIKPDVILACGVNARKAVQGLNADVPTIYMPHPAYRALRNETLEEVKQQIQDVH